MLVKENKSLVIASKWRRCAVGSLVILLLSVLSLAPYLTSSTELVRLRNALLLINNKDHRFDWTPDAIPADFILERGPIDPVFVEAAGRLGLAGMSSDWDKVTAISRHLLSNPNLIGTPIQSNLRNTYHSIIDRGTGYCGDFTRVFMAFAITVGIPVRAWSFSFDGFGGQGHIWPEIWNRQLKRWQLIDIFNNYYFTTADGVPVSALEFRRAMMEFSGSLRLMPLNPGARPGYVFEEKAWNFYRRGLPEWYLSWGNNVFSYDRAFLVQSLGHISRSFEQLGGIAQDVYPRIQVLNEPGNQKQLESLIRVRHHLMIVGVTAVIALVAFVGCLIGWGSVRRRYLKVDA